MPLQHGNFFERLGAVDADAAVPASCDEDAAVGSDAQRLLAGVFGVGDFVGWLKGYWWGIWRLWFDLGLGWGG